MNLLQLATTTLSSRGIPHALVGGLALAAHGFARATLDADVLVVASATLDDEVWDAARSAGVTCDVRRGAADDPFRGVIRISAPGSHPVDVLVGRHAWQRDVISRAKATSLPEGSIPVVRAADLVLLKLFAGGPHDLADVQILLTIPSREDVVAEVDSRIDVLPVPCREEWTRLKSSAPAS